MPQISFVSVASVLAVVTLSAGCGTSRLTDRSTNPVIKDYLHTSFGSQERQIGILATGAAHRVITTRMEDGGPVSENGWTKGEYCAEPPPDASVSLAGVLSAGGSFTGPSVAASGDNTGTSAANAEANYFRSIASSMAPLLRRSQGLQWARDQMALLCSDYANRRLNRSEYIEMRKYILSESVKLINAEIGYLPTFDVTINADGTTYMAPTAATPPGKKPGAKAGSSTSPDNK